MRTRASNGDDHVWELVPLKSMGAQDIPMADGSVFKVQFDWETVGIGEHRKCTVCGAESMNRHPPKQTCAERAVVNVMKS